ncbi:hypothetical protein [Roseinatronobacter alkalisoli]|uniref:Uncharacterized protein n=1 Tax=Roseinatronobacter alkalisoli TaxID=3028235 RepID=A0ABT5T576_9RHOB|nr:hypothetical protein [Roseinatronobacter sp. HJB301]MDD7970271.1 hypothetical protein [Roseinatronobacter sp. HJB301]
MQVIELQIRRASRGTAWRARTAVAAFFGAVLLPLSVQAQLLSIGGGDNGGLNVGVSLGGISAGVGVGGDSLASVDASVGSNINAGATIGGSDGLADVSASVGNLDADATVLGTDSALSASITTGSTTPGVPGTPTPPPGPGPGPGATPGQQFPDINTIPITQRHRPSGRCAGAGNYDVLNGLAVLDSRGTFLGVVVGAYVTGTELTRVRIAVDPRVVASGGCVEYSTAGGRATPQGIMINTTQDNLQASLSR